MWHRASRSHYSACSGSSYKSSCYHVFVSVVRLEVMRLQMQAASVCWGMALYGTTSLALRLWVLTCGYDWPVATSWGICSCVCMRLVIHVVVGIGRWDSHGLLVYSTQGQYRYIHVYMDTGLVSTWLQLVHIYIYIWILD